jgi:hypothetical protein
MSITVETLATKRVVDTRTDVNSYARRTYQIYDGPQDTGFVKFNPNGGQASGNQLNFTLNPPSTRVFVNRRIVIEATFEVTLKGFPGVVGTGPTATPLSYLVNYEGTGAVAVGVNPAGTLNPGQPVNLGSAIGTNGPRAYPLANATRSLQVSINNDQLSQNLGQYWRATTRYANSLGQSEIDQGSTATMLDLTQAYEQSTNNNISPFAVRGANPLQTSRTSLYGVQVLRNDRYNASAPTTELTAIVRFTVREPLYLSPFLFQRGDQDTGLIGVQTMNLQLQLGGRGPSGLADAVFSANEFATFELGAPHSITATTAESYVYMNFLTPDALQIIPDINNYPYYEPTLYTTTNSETLPAGQTRVIEMNNVQLNSIPQRILIFVDEPDSQASVYKTDTFASIENVNISFDNRDSLLAAASPIDLYNIAAKNNTNLTWSEWNRDCGSVLCLNFGEDIPLRANQAVGLRGSYNLRMTIRVRNVKTTGLSATPDQMNGTSLHVLVFGVGVMTIAQQNVVRTVGILTNEDVLRSKMQPALPYMPSGDLYGGGWFDDLRNAFMSVARPLAGIASKVLPMLAPETAPFVGAFNSIINPEPSAGPGNTGLVRSYGNGLVGGNVGGRLVGGKKVSRAQLAKMLK